jgi:very-short-patch-repair endonuclease
VVDALWRRERLAVETDGLAAHGTRAAFERDRHRDAQLLLAGFKVVRFTWRQVIDEASQAATTLRVLLEARPGGATREPAWPDRLGTRPDAALRAR